ncbi:MULTISPECIES: CatB-related O-acetyltransferase [unclassified Endozoicomonas]|uniref:CatB-related O-acetyltransferase n=1 Tax=unclassified Endozoicomonas TaxID=2644528 RepID=UPI003BB7A729
MFKILNKKEVDKINSHGLEIFGANRRIPLDLEFERPCGLKGCNIDQKVKIGAFSYVVSGYLFGVEIGRYCSFGENVQIGRQDHPIDWMSTSPFFYMAGKNILSSVDSTDRAFDIVPKLPKAPTKLKTTKIGNDVWIGHGAFIKPGITINTGAIIAAGSVVTKNVEPYSIMAGNPAKHIRYRVKKELIPLLLKSKWWELSPSDLRNFNFSNLEENPKILDEISKLERKQFSHMRLGDIV